VTGPPSAGNAYSLFVIAQNGPNGYRESFTWFRPVDLQGKGIPRYFDHLDLDGDGEDEIVLDVLGEERRWFAVLDRSGDGWAASFQDQCGSVASG
jgi:hypothetical protein